MLLFSFIEINYCIYFTQGCHGDLTLEERQILRAEFYLRHGKSAISIAHEYAKRKEAMLVSKL